MGKSDEYLRETRQKIGAVRLRTWTLTLAILCSLALYILVNVTTRQSINWVDFIMLCVMQIVIHAIYFPDGDLFGQKDETYIKNRQAYNTSASGINDRREIGKLREYCEFEFQERKTRYIQNQCGFIGITFEEFNILKQKSEKQILQESFWVFNKGNESEYIIQLTKQKRKALHALIFKRIPVEKNHHETIMSAYENNGNKAIRDTSISYKAQSYIKKILTAIVIGGFFAYIGYTLRDGFGFAQIVQICMYLTTMFTTAVMAFTSGETCSKIHKSHFYLNLYNFIDGFNEWNAKNKEKGE